MSTYVIPVNEELLLTGFIRDRLAGTLWASALVNNRLSERANGEEVAPGEDFAVIVRSDGGPALEPPTFLRRFGIRIFGPDGDDNHVRTSELARHVAAALQAAWRHTEHVADTRAVSGPYRVPPAVGRPEMYLTCELVLVGEPINI